jgi:hypothetical protein
MNGGFLHTVAIFFTLIVIRPGARFGRLAAIVESR